MLRRGFTAWRFARTLAAALGPPVVMLLLAASAAVAADYTWNQAGSGSWGTSTNWTPNGVPGAGDTASIGTVSWGSTISLDGSRTIVSLTITSANDFTVSAGSGGSLTLTSTGTAIAESGSGRPYLTCPIVLGASQTWNAANGSAIVVSGNVSGAFTLTTSGDWVFSGTNTWTRLIASGVIASQSGASLGSAITTSGYQFHFQTVGATYATDVAFADNGLQFIDVFSNGLATTLTGVISGARSATSVNLTAATGGSITIAGSAPNTWSGAPVRIYNGTVCIAKTGAFGTVNEISVGVGWVNPATPRALFSVGGITCDRRIYIAGKNATNASPSTTVAVLGGTHTSGTSTFSSTDQMNLANDLTLTQASGGRTDFVAAMAFQTWEGNSTIAITKTGGGIVGLFGNSTFTQAITLTEGTLVAAANNAFGTAAGGVAVASGASVGFEGGITYSTAEPLTINGSGAAGDGAVVNVSGTNSFAGALTLASAASIGAQAGTLTLSGAIANGGHLLTVAGAGNLSTGGGISGTGGLTKVGAGTATIGGASAFSGPVTVSAGTLTVSATCSGGGAVSVASGARLAGTGSLAGAVTVQAGGAIAPGTAGAGTLTITAASTTALALNASSVLEFDLGTSSDRITCSGSGAALILDGIINVSAGAGFAAGTYTLISYTGTLTDHTLAIGTMPAGYTGSIDTGTAGQVRLVCAALSFTARETADADLDGRIDRIRMATSEALNDDFSGLAATVAGYTVSGFSSGTASDNEFFILIAEGASADTDASPAVRITANSSLRPSTGGGLFPVDVAGVTPTDAAKPTIIAATFTDIDANGVDAGDTITLTFSEAVTVSGMLTSHLGLPVSGDSLAASTIAAQGPASTITVVLAGGLQLTPGGVYAAAGTSAGSASGIYLASGTAVVDAAGNAGGVQGAASAVDLGPGTAATVSVAWEAGSDPTVWAVGTILTSGTANTVDPEAPLDLRLRNRGTGSLQLLIRTSTASPAGWSPAGAPGSNAFMIKCDTAGTASNGPSVATNYALTLSTSNQVLRSLHYPGTLADVALYFAAPTVITVGGGAAQTITVTVTAQLAP